jgi:hypothetical protein
VIYSSGDLVSIKRRRTISDTIHGRSEIEDIVSGLIVYGSTSDRYVMDRPIKIISVTTYSVMVEGRKRSVDENQIISKI